MAFFPRHGASHPGKRRVSEDAPLHGLRGLLRAFPVFARCQHTLFGLLTGCRQVEHHDARARLIAEIRIGEDDVRPLWFEVEEKYGQYLCAERSDAFLIGLLNFAQREWLDIVCEAPVTARLLYQIRTYLIPSLTRNSKVLHETRIEAPMDDTPMDNAGGVGTGISCGVDSLHVVKNYAHSPYPGLSLTHLCLNNVGAFLSQNGNGVRQYAWQAEHARQFAKEYGFELIVSDSNMAEAFGQNHLLTHTYSSCFAIYALQKLWKVYFYASSGYDLQESFSLTDNERYSADHYELLSLDCFSTPSLQIYSEGCAITRFEKERDLADWPPAQKYLHVCTNEKGPNCNTCPKCLRTLTALDALGCLQRFDNVFDVAAYCARRDRNLAWLYGQHIGDDGDIMVEPTYEALKDEIPLRAKARALCREARIRLARVRWLYAAVHPVMKVLRGKRHD